MIDENKKLDEELPMTDDLSENRLIQEVRVMRDTFDRDIKGQIRALDEKVSAIPVQLERLRLETINLMNQQRMEYTTTLENLRRDMNNTFLTKSEYEPKHATLTEKIRYYDSLLADSPRLRQEYDRTILTIQRDIQDGNREHAALRGDLNALSNRAVNRSRLVLPWVAIIISISAIIAGYLEHFIR